MTADWHKNPIAVAIPTFNGERHLAEAIRSALAQGSEIPILISDDRSDDATIEIVRQEAGDRAKIVINSERLGLAGNWNQCIARSDSPFVAILHQDDIWRPGHLAEHQKAIGNNPSLGLIASGTSTIDAQGNEVPASVVERGGLGDRDRYFAPGEALIELAVANPFRCSAVTIAKKSHQEIGGFDPSFRYVVDWDFWLRVAAKHSVAWLATTTVNVRWHTSSETHRFATGTADLDETIRLLDRDFPSGYPQRRRADHRIGRAFLNRAHVALRAGNATLARESLRRAIRLNPSLLGRIAIDPKLAAQMAALTIAPDWAARIFRRTSPDAR